MLSPPYSLKKIPCSWEPASTTTVNQRHQKHAKDKVPAIPKDWKQTHDHESVDCICWSGSRITVQSVTPFVCHRTIVGLSMFNGLCVTVLNNLLVRACLSHGAAKLVIGAGCELNDKSLWCSGTLTRALELFIVDLRPKRREWASLLRPICYAIRQIILTFWRVDGDSL